MTAILDDGSKVFIPMSVFEITFLQFIEFRAIIQGLYEVNEEEGTSDEEKAWNSQEFVVDAVGYFCGEEIELPFDLEEDKDRDLIGSKYQIVPGDELSYMRLYAHITNMIEAYEPEELLPVEFQFRFKDNDYFITPDSAMRLAGYRPYTVGEVIETLEIERRFSKAIKQLGDKEGNLALTLSLSQLAILARKKDEELPHKRAARRKFINTRARMFQDIPLGTVLNIRFFLLNTIRVYIMIQTSRHSSKEKSRLSQALLRSKPQNARRLKRVKLKRKGIGV